MQGLHYRDYLNQNPSSLPPTRPPILNKKKRSPLLKQTGEELQHSDKHWDTHYNNCWTTMAFRVDWAVQCNWTSFIRMWIGGDSFKSDVLPRHAADRGRYMHTLNPSYLHALKMMLVTTVVLSPEIPHSIHHYIHSPDDELLFEDTVQENSTT